MQFDNWKFDSSLFRMNCSRIDCLATFGEGLKQGIQHPKLDWNCTRNPRCESKQVRFSNAPMKIDDTYWGTVSLTAAGQIHTFSAVFGEGNLVIPPLFKNVIHVHEKTFKEHYVQCNTILDLRCR